MIIGIFDNAYFYKIIDDWDSNFPTHRELHKKELEQALPRRLKTLKKNIVDVINISYRRGQAYLFDIDMALEKEQIELGGRSVGISNILNNLKVAGIVGKDYPYRLTRSHRDAVDQIYLKNLFP